MKNILVTGGAGYIGSVICNFFLKKNFNIFIIDNLSRGHKKLINKKSIFFKLDLNNKKKVRKIIVKYKIDTIIHMAALIRVDESIKHPERYNLNNVAATK
jgi:UDP-glucose 4-epimerase